jgi:hypothetical protein
MVHVNRPQVKWSNKYQHPMDAINIDFPMPWIIAGGGLVGYKAVSKFGQNDTVGDSFETVWDGNAPYVWPTTATVASVTGGAQDVLTTGTGAWTVNVSGLDADYNEYSETINMSGATPSLTTGKFIRLFRMSVLTAGSDGTNNAAITAAINGNSAAIITAGYGQTLMALWTVPANYTGYLINWYANTSVISKANETRILTHPFGGAWNTRRTIHINGTGLQQPWEFPLILTEKTDVEIQSKATAGGGDCAAGFDIVYNTGG